MVSVLPLMTDVKAPEGLLRVMLAYPGPFVILSLSVIVVLTQMLLAPLEGEALVTVLHYPSRI